MKTSLEHLPERKQRELARVVGIIQEEFANLVERSKSDAKKDGPDFQNHSVRFLRTWHLGG